MHFFLALQGLKTEFSGSEHIFFILISLIRIYFSHPKNQYLTKVIFNVILEPGYLPIFQFIFYHKKSIALFHVHENNVLLKRELAYAFRQ